MAAKPRILVVDDDELVANTMGMVLDCSGFHSTVVFSGEAALDSARTAQFDILLSDVMMEPTNGIQLAIAFQAIHPAARIFLMSGNQRAAALLLDAVRSGYDFPVFAKPIPPADLLAELRARPQSRTRQAMKFPDGTALH